MNISPTKIQDERSEKLIALWESRCSDTNLPARQDFSPGDLVFALGSVALLAVEHDPLRFRFKLEGSTIGSFNGFDATGCYLDEHPNPEYRDTLLRLCRQAVGGGEAATQGAALAKGQGPDFKCVMLPLSDDGQRVSMFLAGVFFSRVQQSAESRKFSAFAPMPDCLTAALPA